MKYITEIITKSMLIEQFENGVKFPTLFLMYNNVLLLIFISLTVLLLAYPIVVFIDKMKIKLLQNSSITLFIMYVICEIVSIFLKLCICLSVYTIILGIFFL